MTELLDTAAIAKLYGVTEPQVRNRIIKTPGFPEPVPGCTVRTRRWLRSEIDAFLHRRPQKSRIGTEAR